MDKVAELILAARALSAAERRRLLVELDSLEAAEPATPVPSGDPLAALRALSGTAHSDYTDISTDKYAHVAAATDREP